MLCAVKWRLSRGGCIGVCLLVWVCVYVGVCVFCDPSHASDMLDVMCLEMETVTRWVYWGVFIGVGTCVCWGVCVLQPKPRIRHAGCYVP